MRIALLLIVLGFGYKIYADANTNAKKSLKRLGRLIGGYLMIAGFLGSLLLIWSCLKYGNYCPTTTKGWMCPFTGKLQTPVAPSGR